MPSISLPDVALCKKKYTLTLAPAAEIDGDHIATIYTIEYVAGEWSNDGVVWSPINGTQSFYFTEAGETYKLRFWITAATMDPGAELLLPYVVGAIYAPAWANIQDYIVAQREVDPCCGLPAEAANITGSGIGSSTPALAIAGTFSTLSYVHESCNGCLYNSGSGVGACLANAEGGYRNEWYTTCSPASTFKNNSYMATDSAEVTHSPVWTASIAPNNWVNSAFDVTLSNTITTSNGVWYSGAIPVTVTEESTVIVRVRKLAGTNDVLVTRKAGSGGKVTSATTYQTGQNAEYNGSANPERAPTGGPGESFADIPCSDARIKLYHTAGWAGARGSIDHMQPDVTPSFSISFVKP